jgi:hypothetical protein
MLRDILMRHGKITRGRVAHTPPQGLIFVASGALQCHFEPAGITAFVAHGQPFVVESSELRIKTASAMVSSFMLVMVRKHTAEQ